MSKQENCELHIYGNGNYAEELKKITEKNNNIKYFGVKSNSYIIQQQVNATLLVNPRPTNEEYTKYSFPSKNMEYMASGTPVLTTKLPGMPDEYLKYVYILSDETANGISTKISEIMDLTDNDLFEKGASAKRFVLSKKNEQETAKAIMYYMSKTK
jgi:glycosyltransferase involved in cell wall biosynthesis